MTRVLPSTYIFVASFLEGHEGHRLKIHPMVLLAMQLEGNSRSVPEMTSMPLRNRDGLLSRGWNMIGDIATIRQLRPGGCLMRGISTPLLGFHLAVCLSSFPLLRQSSHTLQTPTTQHVSWTLFQAQLGIQHSCSRSGYLGTFIVPRSFLVQYN